MTSLLKPKTDDKETKAVQIEGNGQADINIFTVASGLLYEVGPVQVTAMAFSAVLLALCLDYDPERVAQHQEQRQILVYRELPFPVLPCAFLDRSTMPRVDIRFRNSYPTWRKNMVSNMSW